MCILPPLKVLTEHYVNCKEKERIYCFWNLEIENEIRCIFKCPLYSVQRNERGSSTVVDQTWGSVQTPAANHIV